METSITDRLKGLVSKEVLTAIDSIEKTIVEVRAFVNEIEKNNGDEKLMEVGYDTVDTMHKVLYGLALFAGKELENKIVDSLK